MWLPGKHRWLTIITHKKKAWKKITLLKLTWLLIPVNSLPWVWVSEAEWRISKQSVEQDLRRGQFRKSSLQNKIAMSPWHAIVFLKIYFINKSQSKFEISRCYLNSFNRQVRNQKTISFWTILWGDESIACPSWRVNYDVK